ncbi:MAG: hypothetical protein ABIJ45_11290 [Candidatus Zixiibacteriota bacterium]
MIHTKLILFEGLAGSGKSTTGLKLREKLKNAGYPAIFYHEFTRNHPVNIYEEMPVDIWMEMTLENCKRFTQTAMQADDIYIFEATVFQWVVGGLLEQNIPGRTIEKYVYSLADIIKPLNPTLIYLSLDDWRASLTKTIQNRSVEWRDKVSSYLIDMEFGKNKNMSGFELYMELNKQIKQICDRLYNKLEMQKLAINTAGNNWDLVMDEISAFLNVK